jgi:hypothetical protein
MLVRKRESGFSALVTDEVVAVERHWRHPKAGKHAAVRAHRDAWVRWSFGADSPADPPRIEDLAQVQLITDLLARIRCPVAILTRGTAPWVVEAMAFAGLGLALPNRDANRDPNRDLLYPQTFD